MPKSNSTELIEELLKTIDRVGLKKTIQRLRDTTNQINEIEVLQEFIIEKTCNVFQISRQTLLTGRENTPNRTKAIGVCSVLLSNHCKIPQRKIASVMRKDTSNINKYIKKYENLDPNFKYDLEVIHIIDNLNKTIIEFNNDLNKTNG
tara:strand:+ start:332 stop:775 length:444 start_codon:yes stop_codon:yes gene_type:complete